MITDAQLSAVLISAGVPKDQLLIFDDAFECPSPDWITKDLSSEFNKFLFDTGIKWDDNRFDCTKFSKSASTIADWRWAKTPNATDCALAFGMFAYVNSEEGVHMICIAIHCDTGDSSKLRVAFYEPQPNVPEGMAVFSTICLTEVKLTETEVKSCVGCLFV